MSYYIPHKMILAVQKVEAEHPLIGSATTPIDSKALEKLVRMIDRKEMDELSSVAATLTRREKYSLCVYLPINTYHVSIAKICRVLEYSMDKTVFSALFAVWQKYPRCYDALVLLGTYDAETYRPENFSVKQGRLSAWSKAAKPLMAVMHTCNDHGTGTYFLDRFVSVGFSEKSNMELVCHQNFFRIASGKLLLQEGESRLLSILGRSEKSIQEAILLHFLDSIPDYSKNLPPMKKAYQKIYSLWGNPYSNKFPEGYSRAKSVYTWWFNYYQMAEAFQSDINLRRFKFWKDYLALCNCSIHSKHSMLVMDFGDYIAIEFESIGAFYLFDANYYRMKVIPQSNFTSTGPFKHWLLHHSNNLKRDTHIGYWEDRFRPVLRSHGIRIRQGGLS